MNDGGPAYPSTSACESWQCRKPSSGMSLRDYFAGQALAGMLAHPETELDPNNFVNYMLDVWTIADAMLLARNTK